MASVLQTERGATVFGEPTFGLGSEAELVELDSGAGLLISVAIWETGAGTTWHGEGIEPDRVVRGTGESFSDVAADQLSKVLSILAGTDLEEPLADVA
jgi:C-terminal processing protease CtpA/Prc